MGMDMGLGTGKQAELSLGQRRARSRIANLAVSSPLRLRRSERARGGATSALQQAWVVVVGGGLGAWLALRCLCRGRVWGAGRRRKKPSALID